jgi:hypothetical protein
VPPQYGGTQIMPAMPVVEGQSAATPPSALTGHASITGFGSHVQPEGQSCVVVHENVFGWQ